METWFCSGFLKSHCLAYLQQIFSIKGIFEMPSCYTNLIFRDFLNTCYSTPIWWGYCWGSFNLYQLGCVGFMCLFPLRGFIYSHQPCFWNNWEAAGGLGSKRSFRIHKSFDLVAPSRYVTVATWKMLSFCQVISQRLGVGKPVSHLRRSSQLRDGSVRRLLFWPPSDGNPRPLSVWELACGAQSAELWGTIINVLKHRDLGWLIL